MREKRSIFDNKRAQRGASLPLALLLFLICALLASVVLSASTAVSGRNSPIVDSGQSYNRLAVSDQAYYSVASAAELFKEELGGSSVTITCEQENTVTTTSTNGASGTTSTSTTTGPATEFVVKVNGDAVLDSAEGGAIPTSGFSIAESSAVNLLFGGASADPSISWDAGLPGISSAIKIGDYDVSCSVSSAGAGVDTSKASEGLAVKAHVKLLDDGRLQLRFDSAGPGQVNAASYSLTLYLDADVDFDEDTEEGPVTVTSAGNSRTETKTVKTIRTATVSWTTSELTKTAGGAA